MRLERFFLLKEEVTMAKRTKQEVLELVKKHDVKFIRLWFTDILGQVKSFAITDSELEVPWKTGWDLTVRLLPVISPLKKAIW